MKGEGKENTLLDLAREAGIRMPDITELYKNIKPYEPIDEKHLTLREFAEAANIKYKSLLSIVQNAAASGCWDLLPAHVTVYLDEYDGRFEVYKGRGAGKVEFRVLVKSSTNVVVEKVRQIASMRQKTDSFSKIWIRESTRIKLQAIAQSSGTSVSSVIDTMFKKYEEQTYAP